MNVNFIVMVCNTIHLFYDRLQGKIKVPILNLVEEVKRFLIKNNIGHVLIIGTPNTIKKGLYKFKNIQTFEPNENEISELSNCIFNFNNGIDKQVQIEKTKKICKKYLKKGAKYVILGCTEFAVMLADEKFPKIDTIDVLIESVIKKIITFKKNNGVKLT